VDHRELRSPEFKEKEGIHSRLRVGPSPSRVEKCGRKLIKLLFSVELALSVIVTGDPIYCVETCELHMTGSRLIEKPE
jgi:hypothetical protein